jgi:hypothetical protein
MEADVKKWLERLSAGQASLQVHAVRLSEGQARLHTHAARVDRELDRLARSMREGAEAVDIQLRALAAESRIHGARLDRIVVRLDRIGQRFDNFRGDVLRGFADGARRHRVLQDRVSSLEKRSSRLA